MQTVFRTMAKRARSSSLTAAANKASAEAADRPNTSAHSAKRTHLDVQFLPKKIATAENAAAADRDPPFVKLMKSMKSMPKSVPKGEAVVYWMRMQDMRRVSRSTDFLCCETDPSKFTTTEPYHTRRTRRKRITYLSWCYLYSALRTI